MRHIFLIIMLLNVGWVWGQRDAIEEILSNDDSFIEPGKTYGIAKINIDRDSVDESEWNPKSVLKISPAQYVTYHDTVVVHHPWVSSREVYGKLDTILKEYPPSRTEIKDSVNWRVIPYHRHCSTAPPDAVYAFVCVEIPPRPILHYIDYSIKPEYADDFPKGLMTVHLPLERRILARESQHEWIPLTEWDTIGKHPLPKYNSRHILGDDEGNYYAIFPEGVYSEIREMFCCGSVRRVTVKDIQNALKAKGYNPGPADNILGKRTKKALTQFQKEHNLPVGNLNMETLQALGVQY